MLSRPFFEVPVPRTPQFERTGASCSRPHFHINSLLDILDIMMNNFVLGFLGYPSRSSREGPGVYQISRSNSTKHMFGPSYPPEHSATKNTEGVYSRLTPTLLYWAFFVGFEE